MKLLLLALSTLLAVPSAQAHMELLTPLPLRSKFDSRNTGSDVDYDNKRPLDKTGLDFPCLHHHLSGGHITAEYVAGESYQIEIEGEASHNGGSCQLSLSYDNGSSWRVIKSMIGNCPMQKTWGFTMPATVPAGENILFAWSWINHTGNREMYMNCARVNIRNGKASGSVDNLPMLFTANIYGPVCRVPEGTDVIFPEPGDQVEYGKPELQGRPPTVVEGCPNRPPPPPSEPTATSTGSSPLPPRTSTTSASSGSTEALATTTTSDKSTATSSRTVTSTVSMSYTTTTICSGTSTAQCNASESTPTASPSPSPGPGCKSGAIICSGGGTTWSLCSNGQPIWMGSVAAGMECRDGKMQRAEVRGRSGCTPDGSKKCLAGGTKWAICNQGAWIDMGEVASGTTCRDS
ncbi:hypothetical protein FN846DRAFT_645846 [Sphaerosporella brunnea]|uniref:Extracellular protein n=1 Tax=Sphaerosporella brunnea TaxID=1250544 RepID=A0A5J5EZU0_9PEZI|nr:hypothetical protein FN846DRAFT_645846 [Sphaerosporella brunnea]